MSSLARVRRQRAAIQPDLSLLGPTSGPETSDAPHAVVSSSGHSLGAFAIQRCGPVPCDCADDERAAYEHERDHAAADQQGHANGRAAGHMAAYIQRAPDDSGGGATNLGGDPLGGDQANGADPLSAGSNGSTTVHAPTTTYDTYSAPTLAALDAILPSDEVGHLDFAMSVNSSGDPITSARLDVTQVMTMPRWTEYSSQCQPVKQAWDRFYAALRNHENGHVTRDNQQFPGKHARFVGHAQSETQTVTDQVKAEVQAVQDSYDTATDHGRTQNPPTVLDTSPTCAASGARSDLGASDLGNETASGGDTTDTTQTMQASRADGSNAQFDGDEIASTLQAVVGAGGGQPLDDATRAFMEPRFGHDFARVRVHTGDVAARSASSARSLAFTVGSDIVFGAGQYAPQTDSGRHLLAHELTHVVQQSAGPVAGTSLGNGLTISDPTDRYEQAAEDNARAVLNGQSGVSSGESSATGQAQREVASFMTRSPPGSGATVSAPSMSYFPAMVGHPAIQRYQAGDTGHGGIEERALARAGFSPNEIGQVYFGNWLRDLSQIPPKALPLINILALGEFNREVTQADLGTYVPSEHLDNPEGGGTFEDPRIQALEHSANSAERAQFEAALAKLSPTQRAAYDEEQQRRLEITEASHQSGLPEYIERGKFHAKQQLSEAITLRETSEGRAAMGNGLHAVEDYFSHSNFVEVAIWSLFREGAAVGPLVDRMAHGALGANAALVGGLDAQGRPQIITGTYAPGGNDWVSRFELIKTEIEHGQLTKAFILGWLRHQGISGEELGLHLGGRAGAYVGEAIGAVADGVTGGFSGAWHGAAAGWEHHSGLSAVLHSITGSLGGALGGALEGGREGLHAGEEVGEHVGQSIGSAIGYGVGIAKGTLEEVVAAASVAALMEAFPAISLAISGLIASAETDVVAEHETQVSVAEARSAGLTGPTHSQLAKDAPDHPLFRVSVKLAEEVDRQIGAAMQEAWAANEASASTQPTSATRVTDLVDKFVSHPSADPWWRATVLGEVT